MICTHWRKYTEEADRANEECPDEYMACAYIAKMVGEEDTGRLPYCKNVNILS